VVRDQTNRSRRKSSSGAYTRGTTAVSCSSRARVVSSTTMSSMTARSRRSSGCQNIWCGGATSSSGKFTAPRRGDLENGPEPNVSDTWVSPRAAKSVAHDLRELRAGARRS